MTVFALSLPLFILIIFIAILLVLLIAGTHGGGPGV